MAVWVKVFDGIVLSTDSATTLAHPLGEQVYNNADKIFNLHRALPVAAMTWGLGHIGPASISTLSKTLRPRLMGRDPGYVTWKIDINDYTVEQIALKAPSCSRLLPTKPPCRNYPARWAISWRATPQARIRPKRGCLDGVTRIGLSIRRADQADACTAEGHSQSAEDQQVERPQSPVVGEGCVGVQLDAEAAEAVVEE